MKLNMLYLFFVVREIVYNIVIVHNSFLVIIIINCYVHSILPKFPLQRAASLNIVRACEVQSYIIAYISLFYFIVFCTIGLM